MAVAHKGAISFGLVYIPIELYTATQDNDVRFNQLAKENLSRVRYVKTCNGCKKELKAEDIVKGFQYEKGKYVVVTDEDFAKIKTEKDNSIQILQFVDQAEISPMYYNKAYQVISQKGGEKAFELLRRAMLDKNKVAIGKTVLGNSETLLALLPSEEGILMETLYFYDEIKEIPKQTAHPKVDDAELQMAQQLIAALEKPFEPQQYKDEYQERLRDMIQSKVEGKEVVASGEEQPSNIINLMDALKASLKENPPPKPAAKRNTRRKSG